jgi:hypothetical protein
VYVKASSRKTKDGQVIRYLQLAHNEWDAHARVSRTKILHSFGREDEIDREGVRRLVAALSRLLDPADAVAAASGGELTLASSRPVGGTYVLDQLWRRLGLDAVIRGQLTGRKLDPRVERVLFALVANRALDYLLTIEPGLAEEAYFQVTDLLSLEVDLLFSDTTSTYFETGEADEPVPRDKDGNRAAADDESAVKETGFRTHGKSEDSRDDLPQVVIGMAVTRDGIPVRVWSWPGNTTDTDLIRQVRGDIRQWTLSRVIWVADRGFTSQKNRRALMQGGGGYIIGEKLRSGSAEVRAALSRQGRYAAVRDNMQVKEVSIGTDDRFVLCFNPAQAGRDQVIRARLVAQLEDVITDTDKLTAVERARIEGALGNKPGLKRFLRTTPGGLLRIGKAKIRAEANLDGKYLLRCSDPHLSAEDIALGYKQLLEVEHGWRDMKQILDLRPVYHRREDRIRAHVLLCWLALLLIRVAETTAGDPWTWQRIRAELQRLHAVTYTGPAGTFRQTTEPSKPQRDILAALGIDPPKKIIQISPAP